MKLDAQTSCTIKLMNEFDAYVQFDTTQYFGNKKYVCYVPLVGQSALKIVDLDALRWIRDNLSDPKRVIIKVESEVRSLVEDRLMDVILG